MRARPVPAPHHRDKVLACARFLHLDESETNALLRAAAMAEELPLHGEPPRPSQDGFIARLFDELAADRGHPLLLLSRAGWGEPPYGTRHAGLRLSRPGIERRIRITGADPQLLDTSLRLIAREPGLELDALPGRLARHEVLWARYTPLIATPAHRERLRSLLAIDPVAEAQPFLMGPVLRRLCWSNLIRERPGHAPAMLGWLCEAGASSASPAC